MGSLRSRVFRRDLGVCRVCKLDTLALEVALDRLEGMVRSANSNDYRGPSDRLEAVRILLGGVRRTAGYWDAHHRHERQDGGLDDMENMITLCVPCHREETRIANLNRADGALSG